MITVNTPTQARVNQGLWNNTVQVLGFGAPHDWNLRGLKIQEDTSNKKNDVIMQTLSTIGQKYGIKKFLAPNILNDTGLFCHQFKAKISQINEINLPHSESLLYRDFQAEGVVLEPGSAFVIAPGDCIIAIGKLGDGKIVAFHAGLNSMFDKQLLTSNTPSTPHMSVVLAMMSSLNIKDLTGSQWWFSPSISPGNHFQYKWDYPERGQDDKIMVQHFISHYGREVVVGDPSLGQLDVRAILSAQLCEYGSAMKDIHISPECTYLATEQDGSFRWNSHRREPEKKARNLFVVINQG